MKLELVTKPQDFKEGELYVYIRSTTENSTILNTLPKDFEIMLKCTKDYTIIDRDCFRAVVVLSSNDDWKTGEQSSTWNCLDAVIKNKHWYKII